MMILYLIISSCFGDLIAFNRGVNTLQKNNFQVLGGQHLANTSPNSLRLLAELLKNNRLRTRLNANKIKTLNSFFQNQIKKPKTNGSSFLEITATVPSKEGHNRKIGLRRKRNLLRKSFIRKWLVSMKFNNGALYKWTLYRTAWNRFWNKSFKIHFQYFDSKSLNPVSLSDKDP